jgi:uncharacterized protein (TIGR02444 family)
MDLANRGYHARLPARDPAPSPPPTRGGGMDRAGPAMDTAADSFWSFSLALYGKPGVAAALIGLQDRLNLDVNMLLYCCWVGCEGRSVSAADLAAVEVVAEPWQAEVVRPLRALRRRLKGGFGELPADRVETYRRGLNDLEIEGERIAQEAMAAVPRGRTDTAPVEKQVAGNLRAYLQLRKVAVGANEGAALRAVLQACCPDADAGAVNAAFV